MQAGTIVTRSLLAIAALCAASACHAASDGARLAQAKAAFDHVAAGKRFHPEATTFGDLDGDGVDDFAAFLGDARYNDDGIEDLQVLVFKGRPDGRFELVTRSGAILGNGRVSHALEIKHGSLYLHRDGSDGCCGHWVEEFQFKRRDGQLMLIGLEQGDYHPEGVDQPDEGYGVNLVTGQSEHWVGSDKHRKRHRRDVPGLKPVPLAGFNYLKFTEAWPDL
jgi:hypothetical protein